MEKQSPARRIPRRPGVRPRPERRRPAREPAAGGDLSVADARSELARRWARRSGSRFRLPPEAGPAVSALLAAALEPERARRRFFADWCLRAARESLRERGVAAADRRRLFSALVDEAWTYLVASLPPERALRVGAALEERVVRGLPEFDAPPRSPGAGPAGRAAPPAPLGNGTGS